MMVRLTWRGMIDRDEMLRKLVDIQYDRNDIALERGKFRVRGDVVEVWPAYEEVAYRIELFGDEVEGSRRIDPLTGAVLRTLEDVTIYPAKHFVCPRSGSRGPSRRSGEELEERLKPSRTRASCSRRSGCGSGRVRHGDAPGGRLLLGNRELLAAPLGPQAGRDAEHAARLLPARQPAVHRRVARSRPADPAACSRATSPQEHARRARLPAAPALDNRPLRFDEWEKKLGQRVFVSATPGRLRGRHVGGEVVEQVIRPTGLVDPIVRVRADAGPGPRAAERDPRRRRGRAVLVTTLTKRMAEDLRATCSRSRGWVQVAALRARRVRADPDPPRAARGGVRRPGRRQPAARGARPARGLDGCILDADKEGFLRSETSLIQTIGRAARHVNAEVVLYADKRTESMQCALDETDRRRACSSRTTPSTGSRPETIVKGVSDIAEFLSLESPTVPGRRRKGRAEVEGMAPAELEKLVIQLEEEMYAAAEELRFEYAAKLRDEIKDLRRELLAAAEVPSG